MPRRQQVPDRPQRRAEAGRTRHILILILTKR